METAAAQSAPPTSRRLIGLLVTAAWKAPALIVALVFGLIAANTVGWNGGAWLWGREGDTQGLGAFVNHSIMVVGMLGCAGVLYFVARVAKWALWGFVPLMLYAALVLGTWDGVASGFDAVRVEAIRHHYANAYALQHMRSSAVDDTCHDRRITLAADAQAICAAHGN